MFSLWKLNAEMRTYGLGAVCIRCIISHTVRRMGLERFSNVFFHCLQKSPQNYPTTRHCLNTCSDLVEIWVIFWMFSFKDSFLFCTEVYCPVTSLCAWFVLWRSTYYTNLFWALVKQYICWQNREQSFYRYLSLSNWRWQWYNSFASFPIACLLRPNIPHFFS